jgi:acyl-CoA synthetase (AMP-forming)/AMP-acid ligase II
VTTLFDVLAEATARNATREAVVHRDTRLTYAQLSARVEQLRHRLIAAGIGPDARVATRLGGTHYVEAFFGVVGTGAIVCPIDPRMPAETAETVLADLEPDLVLEPDTDDPSVALHELLELPTAPNALAIPPSVEATSPAAIFQTAGTHDRPLGVLHSHAGLMRAGEALEHAMRRALMPSLSLRHSARTFGMYARLGRRLAGAARNPTALVPLALQGISGHTSLFNMLATGGRLVVTDGFHPHRTLELVERERVTNLGGTPMMFELLLRVKRDYDLSSLLVVISGGELASPRLLQRMHDRFGCLVGVGYGATELGGAVMLTGLGEKRDKLDTVGVPLTGVQWEVDGPEGELRVRVETPMLGYWHRPDLTMERVDANGWYRTGDLVRAEPKGAVRILGRMNDVLDRDGVKVPAARVERVLESQPGVDAVAVVAVDTSAPTPELVAFVEHQGERELDLPDLRARAASALPDGWELDRIVSTPHLPRTSDGKVRKEQLRSGATP